MADAKDLTGMTFRSSKTLDASMALDLLALQQMSRDQYYQTPTFDHLYNEALATFAEMERPNFHGRYDKQTVYEAFAQAYEDENWLPLFQQRLKNVTGGKIRLEEANVDDFNMRAMGPAKYLRLTDGQTSIKVMFGPYATPFTFDRD